MEVPKSLTVGECVLFYECDDRPNFHGLLDIRYSYKEPECPDVLEVCCAKKSKQMIELLWLSCCASKQAWTQFVRRIDDYCCRDGKNLVYLKQRININARKIIMTTSKGNSEFYWSTHNRGDNLIQQWGEKLETRFGEYPEQLDILNGEPIRIWIFGTRSSSFTLWSLTMTLGQFSFELARVFSRLQWVASQM